MKIDLTGKTALVCGASDGIGKEIAIQLAESQAKIILLSRTENKLRKVLKELSGNGSHSYYAVDLNDNNSLIEAIEKMGNVDIIINNSGGPKAGTLIESDIGDFDPAFNSHLKASHTIVKHFANYMKTQQWGRVINIVSVGAREPIENLGVSNTLRGAMLSWAKTLSREMAPFQITVNNILPGYTDTERLRTLMVGIAERTNTDFKSVQNNICDNIPAKRLGYPKELAYLAAFLSSDFASYINGQSIAVDGGFLKSI